MVEIAYVTNQYILNENSDIASMGKRLVEWDIFHQLLKVRSEQGK